MDEGNPNGAGNHRKSTVQSVEDSIKRLNTDYIDILWLHTWDFMTPPEVTRAFDDLVRAGKVLYIGISDAPAWVVAQCNTLAELRGWRQFIGLQIEYSLIQRDPERELLPMAHTLDIGVTVFLIEKSLLLTQNILQLTVVIAVIELRNHSVLAPTFVVAVLYFVAIITLQKTF